MCQKNTPTDDELLAMASQDRPISRYELGIQTPSTSDGLQVLSEGFNFLQFAEKIERAIKKGKRMKEEKNKETVTIDMYADSTGLYTEAECNEDNTASFDVPVEIVREYFYKELKDYYPDKTYEEWITEEYTMDDFEHGFIDLAEKRGYKFKRSDGIEM